MARKDQIEKAKKLGIDVSEHSSDKASELLRIAQLKADQIVLDKLVRQGLKKGVDVELIYGDIRKCRQIGHRPGSRSPSVMIDCKSKQHGMWVHPALIKRVCK